MFKKLLHNQNEEYNYYVIIPHFMDGTEHADKMINAIPKEKLILLDKSVPRVTGKYVAIYENFEKDIYISLEEVLPLLSKYNTINIILPEHNFYKIVITTGLCEFCQEYTFDYKFVHYISNEFIKKGKVYISLMECDIVDLIGKILDQNLVLGKDVGVISYN
jgi:hypothetical protein